MRKVVSVSYKKVHENHFFMKEQDIVDIKSAFLKCIDFVDSDLVKVQLSIFSAGFNLSVFVRQIDFEEKDNALEVFSMECEFSSERIKIKQVITDKSFRRRGVMSFILDKVLDCFYKDACQRKSSNVMVEADLIAAGTRRYFGVESNSSDFCELLEPVVIFRESKCNSGSLQRCRDTIQRSPTNYNLQVFFGAV